MAIEKVIIQNFKKFKNPFEVKFNENINLLVGDNESGKSTILEAIHVALTGMYAGRNIRNQLSTYLFNREAVEEYLASVENGQPIAPPEIMIELYFKSGTLPEYEGNGNSEKSDGIEGIRFTISFSDKFNSEYESLLKTEKITSLPIEFYEAKWFSFSRDEKMPRFIPIKSVMIDSSNYRYQNGSDVYISRVVKDFLEPEDITAITQAHRNMIDEFAQNEAIQSINEKISAASTVMNGKLSLSADQGVQNSWESSLVTQVDGIPFAHAGKGAQCIIKTQLALSHKQAEKASIILIEEPESHLSFSRLSELMGVIEKAASGRQIIASTHSSFVANKLGLENLILLSGDNCCSMQSLKKETFEFFKKVAGYDTLRLILCKKSILVEGDSDELVVQRAYMDTHEGRLPIQDGIDVMTVGGVTFKRYLEIAQTLNKETAVVTDNDGNIEAVKKKYKEYEEIKKLHEVGCNMTLVGDPRQTTYRTHYEAKYKKYAGGKIVIFVQDNIAGMNIDTTTLSTSHRNNQIICDLANQMYPDMKPCDSAMNEKTGHDGIFWVHENDIDKYVDIYNPVQLRYDKRTKVNPIPKTMNFGLSKGLTFNRVLIYPTKPMLDWLSGKSKDMKDESLSKFYVAVTRARYSVAFVYKTKRLPTNDIGTKWTPDVLE